MCTQRLAPYDHTGRGRYPPDFVRRGVIAFGVVWFAAVGARAAEPVVSGIIPATVTAGSPAAVELVGKDLAAGLRGILVETAAPLTIFAVEPAKARATVPLPPDMIGPVAVMAATQGGPGPAFTLVVDDLPLPVDNGAAVSRDTPREITPPVCVDGTTAPGEADRYRFPVAAGQRIAIEVVARRAGSTLDPVVRLFDSSGRLMLTADDRPGGLDCRLAHTFTAAGHCTLELRHASHTGSHRYHLRVGDFPIVSHGMPLAVKRGGTTRVAFGGPDGGVAEPADVTIAAAEAARGLSVAARLPGGRSSTWVRLLVHDAPQIVEAAAAAGPLQLPIGISGRLEQPRERDSYVFTGRKDARLLVTTRARSLGCGTVPRVRVLDPAGKPLVETPVSDADEPELSVMLPVDGDYRLEIDDLAGRGGPDYGYFLAIEPAPGVALAVKPEAKTRDTFAVEPRQGCAPVDIVLKRAGYDGPLEISFVGPAPGLRIENPIVPAKTTEARLFLVSDEGWTDSTLAVVRLVARPMEPSPVGAAAGPAAIPVTTAAIRRLRAPVDAFPAAATDGVLVLVGVPGGGPRFTLAPRQPVELVRTSGTHSITLALERLDKQFTGPVAISGAALPPGYAVAARFEKDTCVVTLTGSAAVGSEPPRSLRLLALSDIGNRTALARIDLPVAWVDGAATATAPAGNAAVPTDAGSSKAQGVLPAGQAITAAAEPSSSSPAEAAVVAAPPPAKAERTLEIHPPRILLAAANDRQQLVIVATTPDGLSRDVSRLATIQSSGDGVATVERGRVLPRADGETELVVEWDGMRRTVPVTVAGGTTPRPIGFVGDVLPALSKQTCSSGACHGSPSGKGGFRLSLRASDPALDAATLLREEFGRRVNPLDPDASLLLLKPLMRVTHGGGRQLSTRDDAFAVIRGWIAAGAVTDPPGTPATVRLEVSPAGRRVQRVADGGRQLIATACLADGSRRDVTHLAAFETSAADVATVDGRGWVTPRGRGEAVILVRYLEHIETVPLVFLETPAGFAWKPPPEHNWIDGLVDTKLRELGYEPAGVAGDSEFIRRVHLDLVGLLPDVAETRRFLADTAADKRERLVERLLDREEYARFQALRWGDLLRLTRKHAGDDGVHKYHRWIEDAFRTNMPHDRFARSLLLGAGSTFENPPAAFYRTTADTSETVETVAQLFLGVRLQCAKCHNHPFDRWSQGDYLGLGAIFDRVRRRSTQVVGESFIFTAAAGDSTDPRTGQPPRPRLPGLGAVEIPDGVDRREVFVDWLLAPDNPFFARVEANRIWSQFFARGVVEPVDDFRDSNPPSNPALLDRLTREFAAGGFDRKRLIRTILASRTYQASGAATPFNRDDTARFSRQFPRPLSAEQLLDAIGTVTGVEQVFPNLPAGVRATQLPAPDVSPVDFLTTFGQPARGTVCACERSDESSLGMALELSNGRLLQERLAAPGNRFRRALVAGRPVAEVIEELYLAAVARPPSPEESAAAIAHVARAQDAAAGVEDVCWALLNSDEFVFQH